MMIGFEVNNEEKQNNLEEVIEDYYKLYAPAIYRRCLWLLKEEEASRDAMHDVFVELLMRKNKPEIRNASSYLFRMATNICLKIIQKKSNKYETNCDELLERIACSEDIEEKTISQDLLDKLFSKVPVSSKEIAVMVYIDKMTYKEVSQEINLSVSGIKKRLNKLNTILHGLEKEYLKKD